jgi:predicted enzyme related to lactoylglutathione lyase
MHGQFVWYELTTPDFEAAKKFYQPLTGWGTQPFDDSYAMWTTSGQPVGGMFRLGDEQKAQGIPPNWMPYVEVNNVDESAKQAASMGAKTMVAPADVPGHGRFAVLADPQGAVFGIYKSSHGSNSWDGKPVLGRFSWHELMTTDYKAAFDFYRRLFNWDAIEEINMGPELGMYFEYGHKPAMYGGMYNRMEAMANVPPFWLPYIYVKDVRKSTEMAKKAGAKVVNGPMEVPGGSWIVVLEDPSGAAIALHSQAAAAPAAKAGKTSAAKKTSAKKAARAKPKAKASARARPKKKAKAKAKAKPKSKVKAKAKKKKSRR